MLQISDDFTLEDIRAIRDDFYERYKDNWDREAMKKEIREGAAAAQKRIDEIRAQKERTA
ncbi:MAG: hypothetical protein LBM41_01315 [Ruminococcus sp.]|jgi:hypothetical protein|nr:hypothetical protein [Ruminococcus sp.]